MPTGLDAPAVQRAQEEDEELPYLRDTPSLELQQLNVEGAGLYCDVSSGVVRPYIPASLRRSAFKTIHGPAHPSGRATAQLLSRKFYWPGLRKDATRWARECEPCQRSKVHRHNRTALDAFAEPDNRFDHIHVDIIKMPLVKEYQYCLTVIDRFSRWPLAAPLKDTKADTMARALMEHWISAYGTPLRITSDQGSQFESALFASLAQIVGAKHIHTSPYHPQSNGLVERFHRTLRAALMCGAPATWLDLLPTTMLGLRTAFKRDLQASPAEMVYGTALRIPGEFFVTNSNPADVTVFADKLRTMFQAIKPVPASRHARQRPFILGDLHTCSHVFRRIDAVRGPLEPPYTGPHRIIKRLGNKTFVISIDGTEKTISTDALKPAFTDQPSVTTLTPVNTTPTPDNTTLTPVNTTPTPANTTPTPANTAPSRSQKRVSFSLPLGKDTRGGVVVGPQPTSGLPAQPFSCTRTPPRADRRKQRLQPRHLFAVSKRAPPS